MADFTKFKVGSTSYNVKDANAGRKLDISGNDLSLKNASGTAISTVTLPAGSKYAVLTLSTVGSDITCMQVDSSEAIMSTASHLIALIKAGGVAYVNYNGVIYAIDYCLDGSAQGVSGFTLKAESDGNGYYTTSLSDFNLVSSIWTAITPSSGGGAPDSIIGTIDVDQTGQNLNTNSFAAIPGTIAVDIMTKLRLSVKSSQGWPNDVGSLTPIACAIKAGYSNIYDTIQAAVEAGASIDTVVLFYEWKPGSWVKVTLSISYNNGLLTITNGTATAAATLLQ